MDQQAAYALPLPLTPAPDAPPTLQEPAPGPYAPPAMAATVPDGVGPPMGPTPRAAPIDLTLDSSDDEYDAGDECGGDYADEEQEGEEEEDDEPEVVGVVRVAPPRPPPPPQQQHHQQHFPPYYHHHQQQQHQQHQHQHHQQQAQQYDQQQQQRYYEPRQQLPRPPQPRPPPPPHTDDMTLAQRLQLDSLRWQEEMRAKEERALQLQAQQPRPTATFFAYQAGPPSATMRFAPLPAALRQFQQARQPQQQEAPQSWIQPRPTPTVGVGYPYSAGWANRAAALAAAAAAPGLTSAAYAPYGAGAPLGAAGAGKKRPMEGNGGGGGGGGYTRQYSERVSRYVEELGPAIHFAVSSGGEFCAKIIGEVPESVVSSFRLTPGARCRRKKRRWYFPLAAHNTLKAALGRVREQLYRETGVILSLSVIPDDVLRQLSIQRATSGAQQSDAQKAAHEKLASLLPQRLLGALAPFQKEGAAFVVGRGGRGLIADEMGLGKTIQAIAVAAVYRQEWPMLVLCPSSARFHWEAELLKWLDADIMPREGGVQVVTDGKKSIDDAARAVILSYDLALRFRDALRLKRRDRATGEVSARFRVVVADECHYLKNAGAQRTKELLPLLAQAKRAVLLSGTPALSRPRELWTQVHCLDQEAWKDRDAFLERYCTGGGSGGATRRRKAWRGKGQGAANLRELHELLKATVMVRRRKADILSALPPKRRFFRRVEVPDPGARRQLQMALRDLRVATARTQRLAEGGEGGARKRARKRPDNVFTLLEQQHQRGGGSEGDEAEGNDSEDETYAYRHGQAAAYANGNGGGGWEDGPATAQEAQRERKMLLMEVFKLTGEAKIPLAVARVQELLAAEHAGKMLVFAHHRSVLDAIEAACLCGVPHIRIDGATAPRERQAQVERFQSDPSVRVALLSLTAAGLALTLTAASRVLFVELFWTPGALLQAEDRCHRIGQTSEVEVEYLLARGTLDDALWPLVRRKMRVLGEMVEGAEGMDMEGEDEDQQEQEGKGKAGDRKRPAPSSASVASSDASTASTGSCASCQAKGGGAHHQHQHQQQEQERQQHRKHGSGSSMEVEALLAEPDGRRSRTLLHQLAREDRDRPLGGHAGEGEGGVDGDDEEEEDYLSSGMSSDEESTSSGSEAVVELVALCEDEDEGEGDGEEDCKLSAPASAAASTSGAGSVASFAVASFAAAPFVAAPLAAPLAAPAPYAAAPYAAAPFAAGGGVEGGGEGGIESDDDVVIVVD